MTERCIRREDQEVLRRLELHMPVHRIEERRILLRCVLDDVVLHLDSRP